MKRILKKVLLFLSAVGIMLGVLSCSSSSVGNLFDDNSSTPADRAHAKKQRLAKRLKSAQEVFQTLLKGSDGEVPLSLLKNTNCLAILPEVIKAAFIVGGEYGNGVLSCKTAAGRWSAPAFVQLGAGSFGWQIGGQSSDLVLFFVGKQARDVLRTSKFTLGADAEISAGPVGRDAAGNLGPNMQGIYSYAHSQGLFAGLSLKGAVLNPDIEANEIFYQRPNTHSFILEDLPLESLPSEARAFMASLP